MIEATVDLVEEGEDMIEANGRHFSLQSKVDSGS